MTTAAAPNSSGRVRATPYARRLARERNLSLSAIAGSGPNGRITGDDLRNYRPPVQEPATAAALAVSPAAAPAPATTAANGPVSAVLAAPNAIVVRIEFAALNALLAQIAVLRPEVAHEDICLKAAAIALGAASPPAGNDDLLLLTAPDGQRHLSGLAGASVSGISALRAAADTPGTAGLAISFIGRAGVRPVAAQLVDGVSARLVVGAPDRDGAADCLLSYDPARIADDAAEDFLVTFRDLVETPFRLLV